MYNCSRAVHIKKSPAYEEKLYAGVNILSLLTVPPRQNILEHFVRFVPGLQNYRDFAPGRLRSFNFAKRL
uniref:Uncharacterized protein n=1 Tax=Candidatus Kentrum sp. FW TaxID=2126338 RepID=A0A450T3J5_9GAMM|nr:MAG: hypothetical protein BECKFW1821C_GA0114237_10019 [Candidatus Kentron sp. FW]